MDCLATRESAAVLAFPLVVRISTKAKQFNDEKNSKSDCRRYVSAKKLQQVLSNLGAEITTGKQRVRVGRMDNAIIIYANGGTVNITFNEKGGAK